MMAKKTELMVAELKVIADIQPNEHCRKVLLDAAERLEETDKIARFFRNKCEAMIGGHTDG
jgi:hypothetical protein